MPIEITQIRRSASGTILSFSLFLDACAMTLQSLAVVTERDANCISCAAAISSSRGAI